VPDEDQTGIVEHAIFVVPNYPEGYSTDDNARALIVAIQLEELGDNIPVAAHELATRYLAFLWLAFDPATKRFRNCLSYEHQWQELAGSEDSHGRALWGSERCSAEQKTPGCGERLGGYSNTLFPLLQNFEVLVRALFALLGLEEYLETLPGDRAAQRVADALAKQLLDHI